MAPEGLRRRPVALRPEARSDVPWLPPQALTEAGPPSRCVCCMSWCMRPGEWGTLPSLSGTCPSCYRPCWTSCQTKVSGLRLRLFPRRGGQCCLGADPRGHQLRMGWAVSPVLPILQARSSLSASHCPTLLPSLLRSASGVASHRLCPRLTKRKRWGVALTLCLVSFHRVATWYPAPRGDASPAPHAPLCPSGRFSPRGSIFLDLRGIVRIFAHRSGQLSS